MITFMPAARRAFFTAGTIGLMTALVAGTVYLSAPAHAQQPPKKEEPAKKADAGSSWVKLCEKQKAGEKEHEVCLTHHERFHPTTGQPLISAAIRKIDDSKEEAVLIMVPLGRLIPPGLVVKVDEGKPIKMEYTYCTALGCVAEAIIKEDLLTQLKKGEKLAIATIDVQKKRIGFLVPLNGFARAYDGKPIDRKVYAEARKQMFEQIRARQIELQKKAAEAAKNKASEGGKKKQ